MLHFAKPDRLLSTREAAEYIGMTIHWLERQRALGLGPDYICYGKKGGKIQYRQSVLDALMASGTVRASRVA